ncbi:VOC family protein [Actinoplanes sp. NPDC051494]|uniref:VOC family protein n=1 Tax=Actinoplanes sp. NPDC051494 TaxID=3363907 RepID=UPI003793068A
MAYPLFDTPAESGGGHHDRAGYTLDGDGLCLHDDDRKAVVRIADMATRLVQIAMKARDDAALGGFWAEALGWEISSEAPGVTNLEPEVIVSPDPVAVCVDLVVSPEPKTVKNRVHVELATTSPAQQAETVARLTELGVLAPG